MLDARQLLDYCEAHQDWLLRTIESLVSLESPTDDKAAVDRCGAKLSQTLVDLGATVSEISTATAGNHLLAELGTGRRQILLLGHFDTVWPLGTLSRMPLQRDGELLRGPGTFDMKAGIGLGLLAARALVSNAALGAGRLVMLWTTDEEVGSGTSRASIEDEARRSDAVFVLEPSLPGGAVKTSRKGCGEYHLTVRGVAAHAGVDPKKGASAIRELGHQISQLYGLTLPAGASINVGTIRGGTRPNVVADEAHAVIDVRASTREEMDQVDAAVRGIQARDERTTLDISGGFDRPPLERTGKVERLYEQARRVAQALGHDLEEGGTGGGSDGNFTAGVGVPTLDGLGAVGDGAHALREHVDIDALADRAALVAGLIATL